MSKQLKEIFKAFYQERKTWNNCLKSHKEELNICYYLASRGYIKINNIDDLYNLYDNLIVNNELLDIDNYNEYDLNKLSDYLHLSIDTITKRFKQGKILLLNYYKNNDLINCKMWFDKKYNVLDFIY